MNKWLIPTPIESQKQKPNSSDTDTQNTNDRERRKRERYYIILKHLEKKPTKVENLALVCVEILIMLITLFFLRCWGSLFWKAALFRGDLVCGVSNTHPGK